MHKWKTVPFFISCGCPSRFSRKGWMIFFSILHFKHGWNLSSKWVSCKNTKLSDFLFDLKIELFPKWWYLVHTSLSFTVTFTFFFDFSPGFAQSQQISTTPDKTVFYSSLKGKSDQTNSKNVFAEVHSLLSSSKFKCLSSTVFIMLL